MDCFSFSLASIAVCNFWLQFPLNAFVNVGEKKIGQKITFKKIKKFTV
jgi:hypothetical protein